MKVIITENQHRLLRRVQEIEHLIGPMMDLAYEYLQGDDPSPLSFFFYDTFIGFITLKIANEIVNRTNFKGDDKIELETQIQRFIETEYIDMIRHYFYSRMIKDRNINESYDKRIFQRRYQQISEFIDRALSRYDVCLYTDVIDFVDRVMDYTADNLYDSLFNYNWDDGDEFYQPMYDFISDHFSDRIHEFYEDSKHYCIDEDGNWIH